MPMSRTVQDDFIFSNFRLSWFEALKRNTYEKSISRIKCNHLFTHALRLCVFLVTYGLPDSMRKQKSAHFAVCICVFSVYSYCNKSINYQFEKRNETKKRSIWQTVQRTRYQCGKRKFWRRGRRRRIKWCCGWWWWWWKEAMANKSGVKVDKHNNIVVISILDCHAKSALLIQTRFLLHGFHSS